MFSQTNRRRRGQNSFCPEVGEGCGKQEEGELAQLMYTHVHKCKNDKILCHFLAHIQRNMSAYNRHTHTSIFIAAVFAIAKL
jgi:hypothetical protein